MRITPQELVGAVGILPTPATPNADRWDAEATVDLEETEKMVRAVVDDGIEFLMTTGTFGECATLTWSEMQAFVDCVVRVAGRHAPVFAGVTTLNTRDTIKRGSALLDLGAAGLFVGRPMWLALDDKAILQFYRDLADAFPNVPLVVYDNPLAFKGKISGDVYLELAKIHEVIASKHVGGPALEDDLLAVKQDLRLLPLEVDWCALAIKYPDYALACWSGSVACAPAPITALSKAIGKRDWALAGSISERIAWAMKPMFPDGDLAKFMNYSIQLGHARFKAAGLFEPGPCRPPYTDAPSNYVEGSLLCGSRWAELQREFSKQPALATAK